MYFNEEQTEKFRNETPGCKQRIHLNSAGASLMPKPVSDTIIEHITLESQIGGYEASDVREKEINKFYKSAGKLFNCKSENIAFTANATDSFSRAVSSIPFKEKDVILTSNEDYISNQITYLSFHKRFGVKIVRAKSNHKGGVDLDDFEKCIKQYNPKLIALTHIPTNSGLIQPVKEIGKICARYDSIYLLDACQSVGQTELNIDDLKCDFLSVTSRKFLRGPRGAGFLYISSKALNLGLEPLFIDMRGADWVADNIYVPRNGGMRFEDWEFAYALLLGTGAAIDYALPIGIDKIEKQVKYLAGYLRDQLQEIENVSTYDKGSDLGGLVTFHIKGLMPDFVKKELLKKNINSVTSLRNFAVIDYDEKGVDWTIRLSPHYFNTIEELDSCIEAIRAISKINT
jgi:selenocysteine lyase/cysteine desulfurase